jgi:hypothetical protein
MNSAIVEAGLTLARLVLIMLAMIALPFSGLVLQIAIPSSAITHELGNAYIVKLEPLASLLSSDDAGAGLHYPQLYENGKRLGPSRSLHVEVRNAGSGAFAMNGNVLRFSASDNSEPTVNQRRYVFRSDLTHGSISILLFLALLLGHLEIDRRFSAVVTASQSSCGTWRRLLSAVVLAVAAAVLLHLAIMYAAGAHLIWNLQAAIVILLASVVASFSTSLVDSLLKLHALLRDNPRTARWVVASGLIAMLAVLGSWGLALWSNFEVVADYSDTVTSTYWKTGAYAPVSGSVQAIVLSHVPLLLPSIFAVAAQLSGATIVDVHVAVGALVFGLTLLSAVSFAAILARSTWAGAIALPVAAGGWLTKLHLGYPYLIFSPTLLLGTWGLGIACATIAAWLLLPRDSGWLFVIFAAAGALACIHLTWGAITFLIIATGDILRCIGPSCKRALAGFAAGSAIFMVLAGPQLLQLHASPSFPSTMPASDAQDWWRVMALRKPFHIYLWGDDGITSGAIWLLVTAVLAWINIAGHVSRLLLIRTGAIIIVSAGLLALSFIVVEVLPNPRLAGLVVSRASLALVFVTSVIVTALPFLAARRWWRSQEHQDIWRMLFLMLALVMFSAPTTSSVDRSIMVASLSFAALTPYMTGSLRGSSRAAVVLFYAALVGGISGTLARIPQQLDRQDELMPKGPSADWEEVTTFLREKTDHSQMVLMPPYPYATAASLRSWPMDYLYCGYSVYLPRMAGYEMRTLKTLYGIDINQREPSDIRAWVSARGGVQCLFERGYRDLIADPDRVSALRAEWPKLGLVVSFKGGVIPHEWVCGPVDVPPLGYPAVFENDAYILYSITR